MTQDRRSERPALDPRMLPTDAFFWYSEAATPELRPLVAGLFLLDRSPDRRRLRASVERLVAVMPRFRQRVVEPGSAIGLPEWHDDGRFDLDYHLREIVLPAPGTKDRLLAYAGEVFSAPLDHLRPLWEAHLIEGLEGGKAAFFVKIHHAVVDGVGSVAMFDVLTQERRGDAVAVPRRRNAAAGRRAAGPGSSLLPATLLTGAARAGVDALLHPGAAIQELGRGLRSARRVLSDLTRPTIPDPLIARCIGIGRRLDAVELSLPELRRIKRRLGVTLNDLVLAAVAGAVGSYRDRRRMHADELICMVPMNLRRPEARRALGNRVGAFYVALPIGEKDPLKRLERIRAQTTEAKSDRQGEAYKTLVQASSILPSAAFRAAARSLAGRIHLICSNVPGPERLRYLAGARVEAVHPFAPVMLGTPLAIALVSYGSTYGVGIDADTGAIPDPQRIGALLEREIAAIGSIAAQPGRRAAAAKLRGRAR